MNRREFMERLEFLLKDIPVEDRADALSYYAGYFEDAGAENEQKVIQELESPEKVAENIKADYRHEDFSQTDSYTEPEQTPNNQPLRVVLAVIAVVVTFPIWIPVLGVVFGCIVGVGAAAFGLLLAAAVLIGCAISQFTIGSIAIGFGLGGAASITLAIGLLFLILTVFIWGKGLPAVIRWITDGCRKLFGTGKEQRI